MAEPGRNADSRKDPEALRAKIPPTAPSSRPPVCRRGTPPVPHSEAAHTASPEAGAPSAPVSPGSTREPGRDTDAGRSGHSGAPVPPAAAQVPSASAEVPSAEPGTGNAREPVALPGTVTGVWSSILSTAHLRLGKDR